MVVVRNEVRMHAWLKTCSSLGSLYAGIISPDMWRVSFSSNTFLSTKVNHELGRYEDCPRNQFGSDDLPRPVTAMTDFRFRLTSVGEFAMNISRCETIIKRDLIVINIS
jgi:hypothetical protein